MKRIYEILLQEHLRENRQMIFISGPRQVGKTTLVKRTLPHGHYLNYDTPADSQVIVKGASQVAKALDMANPLVRRSGVIFDELHKFPQWKKFLKGFFDSYGTGTKIAVTGSARLNVYKRGGDSLMGRYFMYRIHPLSAREVSTAKCNFDTVFQNPVLIKRHTLDHLLQFGGYPEPFLHGTLRFYNRWKNLRLEQLFSDDVRDLSRVQDIRGIRALAELLAGRVGSGINYFSLSGELSVSAETVKSWISLLESIYYCYGIRPWFKNVANSIRKQPKIYLWDWSLLTDDGAKKENLVASHLLKAVHGWSDAGVGTFDLFYLRDKSQREVDFLVTRDQKPFLLVECKNSHKDAISPQLEFFQKSLQVPHAFQVCFDLPQSDIIPTNYPHPIKISILDLLKILL